MIYNPISTYRIQFSKDFTLKDLNTIIPYLHHLGIRTIYASPLSGAVPGSEHGYDVTNPLIINPEVGTLEEFRKIHQKLKSLDIGWIQDFVPNHMALSVHNPWIRDILENGEKSEFSGFFDIDWHHPDEKLKGKLMLPVLEKPLDEIIASEEISVACEDGSLNLTYYGNKFPLNYDSYLMIIREAGKCYLPVHIDELDGLINRAENDQKNVTKVKEVFKTKYVTDINFRNYITGTIRALNSDRSSLKKLIGLQHYVPAYWKDSSKMINYRRFFTINGLICLKSEQKKVFDAYHSFIGKLCRENLLQGLRVDHIDGLFDPREYLERLRELAGDDKYIVVEKILGEAESIEKSWPVQGETGYRFLAMLNNLLTCNKNFKLINRAYKYWNKDQIQNFDRILYQKKRFVLHKQMAGDLDNLYHYFIRLNFTGSGIFDPVKLKAAIAEFLISCPVYRIYNNPGKFRDEQIALVNRIFKTALAGSPDLKNELLFLMKIFTGGNDHITANNNKTEILFRRFMQFSGPLLAKGGEDTAFYTFNRFIAHNEVGDSPGYFGMKVDDFHTEMTLKQKYYPLSLNTTSTHDTKRGEDTRARLTALGDIPKLWTRQFKFWHTVNRRFRTINKNAEIPSLNDEYFIYQTIVGSMPFDPLQNDDFEKRLLNYIVKALREGKINSDWSEPNEDYERNTQNFIHNILLDDSEFHKSLKPFLDKLNLLGIINSISQMILKFTAPGVPDLYQGSEIWNFSFVDPDNRRSVDFGKLERELYDLKKGNIRFVDLFSNPFNPSLKLLLTNILLELRNSSHNIFEKGEYLPLTIKGKFRNKVMAYVRRYQEKIILIAIPLYPGELFDNKKDVDMKDINWRNTRIIIPDFFPVEYENILTGTVFKANENIPLHDLFHEIPFGLLKASRKISDRKAGILMHISSLPGKYPAGDFGHEAYLFADFLRYNGQSCWQILPLNQTYESAGHSPYSPLSAFAGNIGFISPELLAMQNLTHSIPEKMACSSLRKSDLQRNEQIKNRIIDTAYERFKTGSYLSLKRCFAEFRDKERYWLRDYSLYITLRKKFHLSHWNEWPKPYRDHDNKQLEQFFEENSDLIEREEFAQFLFQQQWQNLKNYCNNKGIMIIGDMPIYISYDSADVWSHPGFFKLKRNKKIRYVAGVPPDYFSEKGQLWNMPVFRWNVIRNDGYNWWKERIRRNMDLYDLLRLDHFRGFSAYWEIPAGEATAVNGRWIRGPGESFFDEIKKAFPDMPFIAEDLGQIDKKVCELRDKYCLPGMRVLQFAFGEDSGISVHTPHNHTLDSIVYTGTHDNDTIRGWFKNETGPVHRKKLNNYLGKKIKCRNCHLELIKLAYSSVAKLVIIPFQDILGLGSEARMNTPSVGIGNWQWRITGDDLNSETGKIIRKLTNTFNRI